MAYDPAFFPYVVSLLRMDGNVDGTHFPDCSGKTWTRGGAPVTKQTVKKFGYGSAYFNGASYLWGSATTDWFFGTGAFTIECWVYINANSGTDGGGLRNAQLYTNMSANLGGFGFQILGSGSTTGTGIGWEDKYGGSNIGGSWTTPLSQGTWHHVCANRENNGAVILLGVDGNLSASAIAGGSSRSLGGSAYAAQVGGQPTVTNWERYFNGYIDDFRITKGLCRYAGSSYTVPTEALPGWMQDPARSCPRIGAAHGSVRMVNPFGVQKSRIARPAGMAQGVGTADLGYLSGTVTEDTPFSRWRFLVSDAVTGERLGVREGVGSSYRFLIPKSRPAMVTCFPAIDGCWSAKSTVRPGELWVPHDATMTPYVYRCTTAGKTGETEPTWATTAGGTTNDGTVVWTCLSRMVQSVVQGPLLAA
jgi:hypothetical protein